MKFFKTLPLLITPAFAFWRHLCHGELGIGRIDPIMAPGRASQHVHAIQGAQNFGIDPTLDEIMASNCTSCSIAEDQSVYWTPQLYFEHSNGTYEIVKTAGGLTAYYFTEVPDVGQPVTAFPKGFRMIAGNSLKRAFFGVQPDPPMSNWQSQDITQQALMEKSLGFNCLNYEDPTKTEGALEYHGLRNKEFFDQHCPEGIRAEIQFPSCWDGINLDSENHTTHVAYPSLLRNGHCPDGYPVRLPTLFFETIYVTSDFKHFPGRLVFANGDPTGFGYHADFINGWKDGLLQRAIDDNRCTTHNTSTTPSDGLQEHCPLFTVKSDDEVAGCKMEIPEVLQNEAINLVPQLPGGVVVQEGPAFATVSQSGTLTSATQTPSSIVQPAPSTTRVAQAPEVTGLPTVSPAPSKSMMTTTSTYIDTDGTTVFMVIVEEIDVVTVTVGPVSKRHNHHIKHGVLRGRL